MRLYDYAGAPSPRKVRLFLAEKGLDLPVVTVDLRAQAQLDPAFLARNPAGTVPVLELDDGTVLTESLAICHYLEQLHPEPNLFGGTAREQALVLMWTQLQTLDGYTAIQDVLRNAHPAFKGRALAGPASYEQIPALAERGRTRAVAFFNRLDARLAESPYVALERFTYADIVGIVNYEFAQRSLRADPAEGRPHLERWRNAVAARPAIAAA